VKTHLDFKKNNSEEEAFVQDPVDKVQEHSERNKRYFWPNGGGTCLAVAVGFVLSIVY
jgi:hypothetical protein